MTRLHILRPLAVAAALLAVGAAVPAVAGVSIDDDDHIAAREALRRERHDGQWRYEVKVLTSTGRVREVKLNARNGAVLEIEDD